MLLADAAQHQRGVEGGDHRLPALVFLAVGSPAALDCLLDRVAGQTQLPTGVPVSSATLVSP